MIIGKKIKETYKSSFIKDNTIFKNTSIQNDWSKSLYELTPFQKVNGLWIKREDMYAPLGFGGINGSKLRQAIYLVDKYKKEGGRGPIVSGTVTGSPQTPMASAVAYNFGLKSINLFGAAKPNSIIKYDMVKMAMYFKAEFGFVSVAYNNYLQKKVREVSEKENGFMLEYGITLDKCFNTPKEIADFHEPGAYQVKNLPDDLETLIVPMGSANSITSILYGLSKHGTKNLKKIYLIGIGPNRINFLRERLKSIQIATGINTDIFSLNSHYNKDLSFSTSNSKLVLEHYDLHTTEYFKYSDEVYTNLNGIYLHPTYEGKVVNFIRNNLKGLLEQEKTGFWIIGGKPFLENMKLTCFKDLGSINNIKFKEYE